MKVVKLKIEYFPDPRNWIRKTWVSFNGNVKKRRVAKVKLREVDLTKGP